MSRWYTALISSKCPSERNNVLWIDIFLPVTDVWDASYKKNESAQFLKNKTKQSPKHQKNCTYFKAVFNGFHHQHEPDPRQGGEW